MVEQPLYVNSYGKIKELLESIKNAAVPQKFTHDFLYNTLGFKSTSDRALISFLKRLGFLSQENIPTQIYKDFRVISLSKEILGKQIKECYSMLFQANVKAHELPQSDIQELIKRVTGWGNDDQRLSSAVGTFQKLVDLAEFKSPESYKEEKIEKKKQEVTQQSFNESKKVPVESFNLHKKFPLGFSYSINLNLPETTDIEVFNAIFKSLKDNLLNEE
ncbi:MAG: DUF5343 domain-containing protein [Nanoarchaeota archaeon]|nr:DUF5343 domain-containing protein [Nanoarchaeota archaeon]